MRIGIDVSQTGKLKAGCGYLSYSLVQALAAIDIENEYILYPTFGDFFLDPSWPEDSIKIDHPNFYKGLGHRNLDQAQHFWRNPTKDYESQLGSPDIIHSINYFCPEGLKKARLLYVIHDMDFFIHPEWTTEINRVGCYSGVFKASIEADMIMFPSVFSQNNFFEIFPHYPKERTAVIPLASRFSKSDLIPKPPRLSSIESGEFWLNVGTIEPRKNQKRLLQAYAAYRSRVKHAFPLVIAGGKGWLMDDFRQTIQDLKLEQSVLWLGYVNEETLQWLYGHCFAFLYPSLFEGFGLPVLEAMSQGAMVITSNTSSLPEVVGDSGLLIDPYSVDSIVEAIEKITFAEESRNQWKQKAIERSNLFSWEKTAKMTLQVYQAILNLEKY
jgi:glycosyltransferase involved in cell wall biosynthesis